MGAPNLPPVQAYHPVTFTERGAAVPFTTPLLCGARVRGTKATGIELVVPNPSGGRGVYILPWSSTRQLCRPTVHDSRLYERLRHLLDLTPESVRLAARGVAAEGFAGTDAQTAAANAAARESAARLQSGFLLRMALLRQTEPPGADNAAVSSGTADLELRAAQAIARLAPSLGRSPTQLASDVEALGNLFASVGLPPRTELGRVPRLCLGLAALRDATDDWAGQHDTDELAPVASMLCRAAATTLALTERALHDARGLTAGTVDLLRAWRRAPESITARITRAEWLSDGWERIVLLWANAKWPGSQRAALLEMAQLVPVLPQEVADWAGPNVDLREPSDDCRVVSLGEAWRIGSARFALVARNEHFRAHNA